MVSARHEVELGVAQRAVTACVVGHPLGHARVFLGHLLPADVARTVALRSQRPCYMFHLNKTLTTISTTKTVKIIELNVNKIQNYGNKIQLNELFVTGLRVNRVEKSPLLVLDCTLGKGICLQRTVPASAL